MIFDRGNPLNQPLIRHRFPSRNSRQLRIVKKIRDEDGIGHSGILAGGSRSQLQECGIQNLRSLRSRGRRRRGFLGRIHFLQLVPKIPDLTLEDFDMLFRFVIELFASCRQLGKKQHPARPYDDT